MDYRLGIDKEFYNDLAKNGEYWDYINEHYPILDLPVYKNMKADDISEAAVYRRRI